MKSKSIHLLIIVIGLIGLSSEFAYGQKFPVIENLKPIVVDIVIFNTTIQSGNNVLAATVTETGSDNGTSSAQTNGGTNSTTNSNSDVDDLPDTGSVTHTANLEDNNSTTTTTTTSVPNRPDDDFDDDFVSGTVSSVIGDNTLEEMVSIYPNPVRDVIYIDAPLNRPVSVTIINMLGQVVYQKNYNSFHQTQVEVSHLHKGIYLLEIKTDNKSLIQKIQIAR